MTRTGRFNDWLSVTVAVIVFVLSFVPSFMVVRVTLQGNASVVNAWSVYQLRSDPEAIRDLVTLGRRLSEAESSFWYNLLWVFPFGAVIAFLIGLVGIYFDDFRTASRWINGVLGLTMVVVLIGFVVQLAGAVAEANASDLQSVLSLFGSTFWVIGLGAVYLTGQAMMNFALGGDVDRSPIPPPQAGNGGFVPPMANGNFLGGQPNSDWGEPVTEQNLPSVSQTRRATVQTTALNRQSEVPVARRRLANAWLVEQYNGVEAGTHQLLEGETRIGRKRDLNDVVIASPRVSRQQAIIRQQGNKFYIHEAGSEQMIYVNGRSVRGKLEIRHNDVIRFGHIEEREFIFVKSR